MVKITEELIRKRAEHNEGEIFSLEELSLHQQDIEKIEYIDKWCKELKILYLQSNLISKIENVGRLKKLEYLNLALNNVERIENLEGCEFLKKLDLTVNFIGELTSVENLVGNYNLAELYLTGNPCTDFEGYRDYVICTLPQLKTLDGTEIKISDRIKALQNYKFITSTIIAKQSEYFKIREKQKSEFEERKKNIDGTEDDNYWKEKSEFTPESRLESHMHQEMRKKKEEEAKAKKDEEIYGVLKKERKYFSDDGRPYSFNDPKVDYEYNADTDENIVLTVHVFKHMDTSLIDIDIQPTYVRVTLKGKSLQLALSEEVNPDSSSAKRSQTTGYLVITMPKAKQIIKSKRSDEKTLREETRLDKSEEKVVKKTTEYLEVDESKKTRVNYANIVESNATKSLAARKAVVKERANSPDFQDNDQVPPLE